MKMDRMKVDRVLPTAEAAELVELVREIAATELAPHAAEAEAASRFPRPARTGWARTSSATTCSRGHWSPPG